MLKSRRGLLAAGLAVAVVGALGVVASNLNAGAEEIPDAPTASVASAEPAPATGALLTPPDKLPWGADPEPMELGPAGASSTTLKTEGFAAAPADTSGSDEATGIDAPKGRVSGSTYLKSEPAPTDPATT